MVSNNIKIDMAKMGVPPVIYAMQNDSNTRAVVAELFSCGVPYDVTGLQVSVAFKKPDGTNGWYDTLPTGDPAVSIDGNVVTAVLAPQVLSVFGKVFATIRIADGTSLISAFPFVVFVAEDPANNGLESENYYRVQNWDEVNNSIEQIYEKISELETTTSEWYYETLSAAVLDANVGVVDNSIPKTTDAKVKVFAADNGKLCIMLLADVSEGEQIDVSADLDLVLNGHTLEFTTPEAYLNFAEGTRCTINGEVKGSAIKKEDLTVTTSPTSVYIINAACDSFKAVGGTYSISGSFQLRGYGFRVPATCQNFELDGVSVNVTNSHESSQYSAKCIQTQAGKTIIKNSVLTASAKTMLQAVHSVGSDLTVENTTIHSAAADDADGASSAAIWGALIDGGTAMFKNSVVFTDAQFAHAEGDHSIGIDNYGELICIDTDVTGTHSAVQNHGDLYVIGGTFNGYAHGGFYFVHSPEDQVCVNNAEIHFGEYTGAFPDFSGTAYAGFYLGGSAEDSDGISVYMDGCAIEGEGIYPFVVRPAKEGQTNFLYISNTNDRSDSSDNIRLNGLEDENFGNRAKMEIGVGCNFTPDNTTHPECAIETGKLYRCANDSVVLDGRDYNAVNTVINEKIEDIPTGGGVEPLFVTVNNDYVASHTPMQMLAHVGVGGSVYWLASNNEFVELSAVVGGEAYFTINDGAITTGYVVGSDGTARIAYAELAEKGDVPTDTHINSLIDTKLGVIENGSY